MRKSFCPELRNARRDQRYPVLFSAELVDGQRHQPVTVRDLSKNGIMLTGDALPTVGRRVVVALGPTSLFGTVVWNQDGYCGLLLRTSIEPLQLVRDMMRGTRLQAAQREPPQARSIAG